MLCTALATLSNLRNIPRAVVRFLKLSSCDKINMYSVYGIINTLFKRDKSVNVFSR